MQSDKKLKLTTLFTSYPRPENLKAKGDPGTQEHAIDLELTWK